MGETRMTMIDNAIQDVAGRFGLGPKVGQLMHEVVHLVTGSPGGVSGFIDKFQISRPRLRSHLMVRQNRRSGAGGHRRGAGHAGELGQRRRLRLILAGGFRYGRPRVSGDDCDWGCWEGDRLCDPGRGAG